MKPRKPKTEVWYTVQLPDGFLICCTTARSRYEARINYTLNWAAVAWDKRDKGIKIVKIKVEVVK